MNNANNGECARKYIDDVFVMISTKLYLVDSLGYRDCSRALLRTNGTKFGMILPLEQYVMLPFQMMSTKVNTRANPFQLLSKKAYHVVTGLPREALEVVVSHYRGTGAHGSGTSKFVKSV